MRLLTKISKKQWCIGFVILWAVLCLLVTPVYTTVTVNYAPDPSGEAVATVFTTLRENVTVKGARARAVYKGIARVSFCDLQYGNHCSIKRIDPLDEDWKKEELVTISSVSVEKNGLCVWEVSGNELWKYFYGNEHVIPVQSEEGLAFYIAGTDSQLLTTERFAEEFVHGGRLYSTVTSFFFGLALMLLVYLTITWYAGTMSAAGKRFDKFTSWIYFAGLTGAVLLCIYIGTRSPFWLNPDEHEVCTAVRYYHTNWMPPDIRSEEILDAFAVYGTTRHSEFNVFYFLAGKIGQFFKDVAVQYRWLNMSLLAAMAVIVAKNCKKYFALLFVLLLTPQIWYICSYTTSDALDFFWGFLAVWQLIKEDSMLNRLLKEPISPKWIPGYFLISLLFVNLFWAKISFYPILFFLFLILLIRMFEKQGMERADLFRKYLFLVGFTFAIFAVRYMITDYPYYGFDKLGVYNDVMELRATYQYKPSTPPHEQAASIYLYNKGVTLSHFFGPMRFNQDLFCTFSGFFGYYTFGMTREYYLMMGGLYLMLFGCLIYELIKMKNKKKWLEFAAVMSCIAIQYLLVFINGYFVDFQPQGRYMLPALLYITYLVYTCDEARNRKLIRLILCATCLLSLYAYGTVGVLNMVPLSTSAI